MIDRQGFEGDAVLDHWLFTADNAAIKSVYCGGVPVVLPTPAPPQLMTAL